MIKINCPDCDAHIELLGDFEPGDRLNCPECGELLVVPRSRRRYRDDWDEEEDRPFRRRRSSRSGIPLPVVLGVGAGVMLLLLVLVVFLALRKPSADRPGPQAPGDPFAVAPPGGEGPVPAAFQPALPLPVNHWERLVGTWRQQPGGLEGHPLELTFLPDRTAQMYFRYADGREVRQNARVEIGPQGVDSISLQLHVPNGLYGYSFKFRDADTIQVAPGEPPAVPVYARVRK
jgi:hypothetical protein